MADQEQEIPLDSIPNASHWLVDCYGCDRDRLDPADQLEQLLIRAADRGNLSVLRSQRHQFHPQGATVLLLLSESHLSLHTWPERGYAALDLFTCGDRADPAAACQTVLEFLAPTHHHAQQILRPMAIAPGTQPGTNPISRSISNVSLNSTSTIIKFN